MTYTERMPSTLVCTVLALAYGLYRWQQIHSRRQGLPLPPGPKGLPLIGNLYDIPAAFEWEQYARWSEEYNSDIIYLNVAGNHIVIVNSPEVAADLFEQRSSMYSSRPESTIIRDLIKLDWPFGFMKYGERWKERRKLFQQHFHPQNTESYQPNELEYVHELLKRLQDTPDRFLEHIRHVVGAITISIAYGLDIKPSNDPYIEYAEKGVAAIAAAAAPGAFLVDAVPLLKYVPSWFPGAGFKQKAEEWSTWTRAMVEVPFRDAEKAVAAGTANPSSFVPTCLNSLDEARVLEEQKRVIMDTAGTFFVGGSDTSVSAISTFILQMTLHPEIQAKAQDELDRVIGKYVLPTFADEPSLPYIGAIVKEILRWHTIAPLAIPHFLEEDDEYNGYFIPRNSLVVGNAWAMLHDKHNYEDPYAFRPERFLKPDGSQLDPNAREPNEAFGFGRRCDYVPLFSGTPLNGHDRICPGRHMATSLLYIAIASMLSVFDISKALDEAGNPITPNGEYTSSLGSHPAPFQCAIKVRSAEAEEVISAL